MGIPEDQEFVKSFREGSKILIARRDGNRTGHFLEATVFGLGGRKGFIIIRRSNQGRLLFRRRLGRRPRRRQFQGIFQFGFLLQGEGLAA